MTVDWNAFTPGASLAGGALIGLAASLLLLVAGRIAGISGILGGLLRAGSGDAAWRIAFVAGLVGAPWVWALVSKPASLHIDAQLPALLVAGFLVGIGTRYGGGCTSGHGVCGVSRLSMRSMVATAAFMAAGFLTVFVLRHLLAL
jgi:uncharacterized membrane protein YedE/YeeE